MSTAPATGGATPAGPGAVPRTGSWLRRHRSPLAPVGCALGAVTAGAVAHGLPDHWWGLVAPGGYLAVSAWRLDHNPARSPGRGDWVFHGSVTAATAIWMIPAAVYGLDVSLLEWAGFGLAVFGAVWWSRGCRARLAAWWRGRRGCGIPQPETPQAPSAPPARIDELVEDWRLYLSAERGPLAGARLTDAEELVRADTGAVYALRATIIGVRGRHKTADLIAAADTIRSGLALPPGAVLVDGTGAVGHTARLTVLTGDSPLRDLEDYQLPQVNGPDPARRWTAPVGRFPDATPIHWTYYIPGSGAVHGLTAGDTGTGKGVATDKVVLGAVCNGAVVLLLDPKDGRSSSVLPLIAGVAASLEERRLMIRGLVAEMRRRNAVLAARPWTDAYGNDRNTVPGTDPPTCFTPGPDMPLIYVIVEEIGTQAEDPDFATDLGELAREARAAGIGLDGIGQGVGVKEVGGATLRANLGSGNVLMLRTKNALTGQRLGDSDVLLDPCQLPATWPGTDDPALGLCVPAGLCAAGRAEMGRTFPNGNLVPLVGQLGDARAMLPPESVAALNLEAIATMRADRLAGRTPPPPSPGVPAQVRPEDASSRELILDILQTAMEPMPVAELAAELAQRGRPVSPANLGNHLGRLKEAGLITQPSRAVYQAVFDVEVLADKAVATR